MYMGVEPDAVANGLAWEECQFESGPVCMGGVDGHAI